MRSLAETALRETAKDLELATWLTEALVRGGGLRGLATGAAIIAGLLERFWDDLYPTPDEDGIETRVGPLAGLSGQGVDGSLMQPLRKLPLFRRPGGAPFGYWQYELSVELSGVTDAVRRQQRLDAGVIAFDDMEKEARLAGPAHWSGVLADVSGALEAWGVMAARLDEHAGPASPSTSRVRDLLMAMRRHCAALCTQGSGACQQRRRGGRICLFRGAVRAGCRLDSGGHVLAGHGARRRAPSSRRDCGLVQAE